MDVVEILLQDIVIHGANQQNLLCMVVVDELHKLVVVAVQQNIVVIVAVGGQQVAFIQKQTGLIR